MGKFIGRDMLLDHFDQVASRTRNELKGLKGEIEVGDLLARYLPDDTYIIAQPTIGRSQPDFLVISPQYGFRLIEVKNWSLNNIKGIQTNGTFEILSKTDNPLQQVRIHADDLKGYLSSNHSNLGDPYKLIGYVTIQYGFNRMDIESFSWKWDEKNANDFFTFHLFKDELNSLLDKRLASASKYRTGGVPENWIEDIVRNIRVSNKKLSDSEINLMIRSEEMDRTANELKELTEKTKQMIEDQKKITTTQNMDIAKRTNEPHWDSQVNRKGKGNLVKVIILILGLAIISLFIINIYGGNKSKTYRNSVSGYDDEAYQAPNIQQAFLKQDNLVKVNAKVESFQYDSVSGNKILKLKADSFSFDAIIFKDTKTPFINEGEIYTFRGVTQEYKGKIELKITNVVK